MIDGLKVTMSGEELRRLLDEGRDWHERRAAWWKREKERAPDDQGDDNLLMPDHMCEHEADRHEWRAEVLTFIRDHIETSETYRLTKDDLEFGELLPGKPGGIEQEEYEERTAIGFNLERLNKTLSRLTPWDVVSAEIEELRAHQRARIDGVPSASAGPAA